MTRVGTPRWRGSSGCSAKENSPGAFDELGVLITSDDPDLRARAVLLLGRVNEARGNVEQMIRAYEVAAGSGHPEVAPFAALVLGLKLADLGRRDGARRALRSARRTGDPEIQAAAAAALRTLPRRRWWWPRPGAAST